MGPFPHDAPRATISDHNPAGTDGFEFVEFAHPEPQVLRDLFGRMGYTHVANHKSKRIELWQQGDISYLINAEPGTHAARFIADHGPCAPSMGWRVADAGHAFAHAVAKGATPYGGDGKALDTPAIVGIGGSLIYFIDDYAERSPYNAEFDWTHSANPKGVGFAYLDHLTHNVHKGNMETWFGFYRDIFNFREIRFFDIEGKFTGLLSRALTSPCGRIRIPINEDRGETGQIVEYLRRYKKTVIGPIFFEFIQRKGDDGFGEGNFRALFESIEADDQERRFPTMPVKNRFAELLPEIAAWRRDIHEHPELQFDTHRTSALVAEKLREFGCDEVVTGIGRTGVVGVIRGRTDRSGRVVGLRADMDALPILEADGGAACLEDAGRDACLRARRPYGDAAGRGQVPGRDAELRRDRGGDLPAGRRGRRRRARDGERRHDGAVRHPGGLRDAQLARANPWAVRHPAGAVLRRGRPDRDRGDRQGRPCGQAP
jgi:4-hydroxyphenylpyruvate dioxygenase-like putative hemolysin